MNELAETGVSGITSQTKEELEKWSAYFQGRLTAPKFSSRVAACARKPEFAAPCCDAIVGPLYRIAHVNYVRDA